MIFLSSILNIWHNMKAAEAAEKAYIDYINKSFKCYKQQVSNNSFIEVPLGWAYWYAIGDEGCI